MSEPRACSVIAVDRKMVRYRSRRPPEIELSARLHDLANERAAASVDCSFCYAGGASPRG